MTTPIDLTCFVGPGVCQTFPYRPFELCRRTCLMDRSQAKIPMRVTIVGAGIAGLAAAIVSDRSTHSIHHLFESVHPRPVLELECR